MTNFKVIINAYDKNTFLDKKILCFYTARFFLQHFLNNMFFNQPGLVKRYKLIIVSS